MMNDWSTAIHGRLLTLEAFRMRVGTVMRMRRAAATTAGRCFNPRVRMGTTTLSTANQFEMPIGANATSSWSTAEQRQRNVHQDKEYAEFLPNVFHMMRRTLRPGTRCETTQFYLEARIPQSSLFQFLPLIRPDWEVWSTCPIRNALLLGGIDKHPIMITRC